MTALTKFDVGAIRKADAICVHLSADKPDGLVRLIKRRDYNKPFSEDQEHVLDADVTVYSSRGADALKNGARMFAMADIYHGQKCPAASILHSLRVGDELTFRFWPDAHSNGYIAAAGLHADVLFMDVRRKGRLAASYELASSVAPENSARMCRGVPVTDSYLAAAAERRALPA